MDSFKKDVLDDGVGGCQVWIWEDDDLELETAQSGISSDTPLANTLPHNSLGPSITYSYLYLLLRISNA
jgi:hypothetical protein